MSSLCAARVARIGQALLVVAASLVALSGCDWINNGMRWTEDVRLPDGRIVLLERYTEFNGKGRSASYQRFSFRHPDSGKTVTWENLPDGGQLSTVALWVHKGQPRLLTKPLYGDAIYLRNCPNPPYLIFEHDGTDWISKPLAEIGIGRIRSNLTTNPWTIREQAAERSHRPVEVTSNSYVARYGTTQKVPYVLDFSQMPPQTFGVGCDRYHERTDLIVEESK